MPKPKTAFSKNKELIHFSVGAIIKKQNKILIIDRKLPPPGLAGVAGHIEEKESPLQTLEREIKEESGLILVSHKFLFKKLIPQKEDCVFKAKKHKWYVYECKCSGELKPSKKEVNSINYLTIKQIKKLYQQKKLEYPWLIIFKKLKII